MDPLIAGSLISAGTSILGGMMAPDGRDQRKEQEKLQRMMDKFRPTWIRQGAEMAGFNPLLFAGPLGSAPTLAPLGNPIGDSIARAGAAVADGFGAMADMDMRKAELELEEDRLQALREEIKLKPQVPGIYGAGTARGTLPGVGGGVANAANAAALTGGDITGTATPIVPTTGGIVYDSTNRPYEVSPGMNLPMSHTETIDIGGVPLTLTLPGAEEMEGVDESLNRLLWGAPQIPYQFMKGAAEKSSKRLDDMWERRKEESRDKRWEVGPRADLMTDAELAAALRGE